MRDMKKLEDRARVIAERIEACDPVFTAAVTENWRGYEITVHDGEHEMADIQITQKHSWDQINLRLTHAGIEPAPYGFKRTRWQREPFNRYNWGGRNYKVTDSVVNAVDKFRGTIPTDKQRLVILARDKYTVADKALGAAIKEFTRSFSFEQLKFLTALGVENTGGETQESLLGKCKQLVRISELQEASDKALEAYREEA